MNPFSDFLNQPRAPETNYRYVKPYFGSALVKPRLFRFVDGRGTDGLTGDDYFELLLEAYTIERFTPKGYWINVFGEKKFVLKADPNGGKRHAYADPVLALESFLIRKQHHIHHLRRRLEQAEGGYAIAKGLVQTTKQMEPA